MISLSTEKVIFDGAATLLQIRHANQSDALVVLDWRNDRLAVEMSFQQHTITRDTHERWFSDNLTDDKSTTLIGICDEQRIGVCRFLVNEDGGYADVSINLNPIFRGKGLAKVLLRQAIKVFTNTSAQTLFARIKNSNHVSMRIFESCDFTKVFANSVFNVFQFKASTGAFAFEKITNTDSQVDVLFSLLEQRVNFISHVTMPSFAQHKNFVLSEPYKTWVLVRMNCDYVGTLYIKDDNTVGLNLLSYSLDIVCACINYIFENFVPNIAEPSFVPDDFVVNIASSNTAFQQQLKMLGYEEIQTTFRLKHSREASVDKD